jgi:hypothetical protein
MKSTAGNVPNFNAEDDLSPDLFPNRAALRWPIRFGSWRRFQPAARARARARGGRAQALINRKSLQP